MFGGSDSRFDLRTKPYPISGNTRAVIHCNFYVRFDGAPDVSEKSIQAKYFLKTDLSDIEFVFDNERVPAHKTILAMASNVFEAQFFGPLQHKEEVKIEDADTDAFKEFLQFLYLPKVKLTMKNIEQVAYLADKYNMADCRNTCGAFLESQLTEENMIWGYHLAVKLNIQPLKKFCEEQISFLTYDAFKSDTFLQCDKDVLKHILELDTLLCSEVELFNACVAWAKVSCHRKGLDGNDPGNVKKELGECFYLFRFGRMTMIEITTMVSDEFNEDLFSKKELIDVYRIKSEGDFELAVFKHKQRKTPTFQWNEAKAITCSAGPQGNGVHLQGSESTWFSANSMVLLGSVQTVQTNVRSSGYSSCSTTYNATLHIIEYNDQTFSSGAAPKTLYTGTFGTSTIFNFPQPILIRPNKMYEVRFNDLYTGYHCCKTVLDPEVKLNHGIIIKTHQKPSDASGNRSLITQLRFNKV
ncbi:BTB/POZ domain-containing protein 2 [Pseudolycoriella hygida]|uniref:BTB/POZ domain-containing protein 2 n=1 Tax=Pseudolycoriella hygida TaxID=35572 RepID=A0A9Q0N7W5_9DIPT|nr:BTB/POZ domain-containing protein 2 [Pseudolycoriella hygida]